MTSMYNHAHNGPGYEKSPAFHVITISSLKSCISRVHPALQDQDGGHAIHGAGSLFD